MITVGESSTQFLGWQQSMLKDELNSWNGLNPSCGEAQCQGRPQRRTGPALRSRVASPTMALRSKWDGRQRNAEVTFCRSAEHRCLIWKDSQWQFAHISRCCAIVPYEHAVPGVGGVLKGHWLQKYLSEQISAGCKPRPLADYIYWSLIQNATPE